MITRFQAVRILEALCESKHASVATKYDMLAIFDAVLAATHNAFDEQFILNPKVSQPNVAPYAASGIYTNKSMDVATEEGGLLSANQQMIGIRLSQFPVWPQQRDQITFNGTIFDIKDIKFDGKGSADLWLIASKKAPK